MSDGRGRGGPFGGHGLAMPAEKPKNFRASLSRLLGYLKPRRLSLLAVRLMAALSTSFAIFSPKLMGQATTRLLEGFLARMRHVQGAGIDLRYILQLVLILAGLYLLSAIFNYLQQFIMAGVAQKTVYELRREVNEKLARLPLKFSDGRTHGEIPSRVTNDVDNIASTLQQSLMQIITSGFTLVGVLIMMFTISPLLTLITLVVIPLALFATRVVAPRAQKHFAEQWKSLGELNSHAAEMYSGHRVIKAFGRERKSIEKFNDLNEKLYGSSWRAQFISGLLMPPMP
jgi:ATP-binding cassette subfamily B protein